MTKYVKTRSPKSEVVYQALREEIISLSLKPGTLIDKTEICNRLSVSRFPVSDALSRLGREGLVSVEPQHGSFVARIRIADIIQAGFIRKAIEGEVCAYLAEKPPENLIEDLTSSLARQNEAAQRNDPAAFAQEDDLFHTTMTKALGMTGALEVLMAARAHFDRVNRLVVPVLTRLEPTYYSHANIVSTIASGNAAEARNAMHEHIDHVLKSVDRLVELQPAFFE
jgi:DNA-binding GntR family transcriptional regulator